jgi:uncharacterized protein
MTTRYTHALITGTSSGIGAAYARKLAQMGTHLTFVGRDVPRMDALAAELRAAHKVRVTVERIDLANRDDIVRLEKLIAESPDLDLLVNNAGFGSPDNFSDIPAEMHDKMITVHVTAPVRHTHAAINAFKTRGKGAVVNVSSLGGLHLVPMEATYGSTKAYLVRFTQIIAHEVRPLGLKAQVLCPGFTHTEIFERSGKGKPKLPSFVWQTAEEVVEASLASLEKDEVVCVPGFVNRYLLRLVPLLPQGLVFGQGLKVRQQMKDDG